MNKVDKLHQVARDIMERLNEKYNITNELSLDEYLDVFNNITPCELDLLLAIDSVSEK